MWSQKTQKLNNSTVGNSEEFKTPSRYASRPFGIQEQSASTQQQQEDAAFAEQKLEATRLEIQAKHGTITPEGQERLTLLQAQMHGLLQARCEHGAKYGHSLERIAFRRPDSAPPVQTKLTIGQPGDKYEQEADETARQVVQRIHQPLKQPVQREAVTEEELQTKPVNNIQRQESSDDEELQMKPMVQRLADGGMAASADVEAGIQQARGSGQPLADKVREPMEQAFGADFGGVRIHTDATSDKLNKSIQARAFTTGQDIFFGQGEYEPGSNVGKELLAHELTHVVQQSGGGVQAKSITNRTVKNNKLYAKSLLTSSAQSLEVIQPKENREQQTDQHNHKQEQLGLETDAEKEQNQQQESANENEIVSLLPTHKAIAAANADANPSTNHNQNFQYQAQEEQQVATEAHTANKELPIKSLPEPDEQPLQAKELGDRTVDDSVNKELRLQSLPEPDEQPLQAKELGDRTVDDSVNKELRLQSLPEPDEQPLQAKELGDRTVDDSANKELRLQSLPEPDKQPLQAKELGDRTVDDSANKELRLQSLPEPDEQPLQAKQISDRTVDDSVNKELRLQSLPELDEQPLQAKELSDRTINDSANKELRLQSLPENEQLLRAKQLPALSSEFTLNKELQKQPAKTGNPIIQAKTLDKGITASPISIQRGMRDWYNQGKDLVGAGVERGRDLALGAVDKGKEFFNNGVDWVKNNVIQPLMRLAASGWGAVKNFGSQIATAYKQANPTIWDVFQPEHLLFRMATNQRKQLFAQAIQAQQNQLAQAAGGIKSSGPAPVQEPSQLERLNELAETIESGASKVFEIRKEILEGAVLGDFKENPTIWNTIGQVAIGFVPVLGQAADIRDIIANVKKLHETGYKDPDAWINLTLTAIGIIPGVGDVIKAIGKGSKGAIRKALSGALKNADQILRPVLGKAKGMLNGARRYGKQFMAWASGQGGRLRQGVTQFAQKSLNFALAAGQKAQGLVKALNARVSGFVNSAMQKARDVASQGRGLMGKALSQFMGMAQNAFNSLQNRVTQAVDLVKAAAQSTKDLALKVGRKVADTTRKATNLLREFTQSAIQKGREAIQKARQWSSDQVKKATELGQNLVKKARDRVTSLVRQGVKLAKDKALAWVKQKIGGIKQRLLGFLQSRWNRLKDKLGIGESGKAGQQGAEGALQTDNAAKKAAELPAAIAMARGITAANDKVDTPVPGLLGVLHGTVKRKYSWIKRFEARPKGVPGHYSIYLIASENYVSEYSVESNEKARRQQLEESKKRFDNFRETIEPNEIKGAPPAEGSATPGHARSAHGVNNTVQAKILNESDRIFSGRNKNGREVDIYCKDGSVVITEAGNKRSVITAYGLVDTKKKQPKSVSPEKWANDPSYVEIKLGKSNEVIYPNKERWEANDWP